MSRNNAAHGTSTAVNRDGMIVIDDAGHFLHLEKPHEVNNGILTWSARPALHPRSITGSSARKQNH
jgi:pimeloyl-ACP methyl ester carboxylesterase